MSSTTTTTPAAGASVSMAMGTAGSGGSSGGGGMAAHGANYFFGFLITFVVLLLIFVGCGIGSRRRFLARRQDGLFSGLDAWGQPRQQDPIIEDKWMYTTPLSMTLLRHPKEAPASDADRDLEARSTIEQNQSGDARKQQSAPDGPDTTEYGAPRRWTSHTIGVATIPWHTEIDSVS
ncbi:hypothetical protein BJ912DRAFT_978975 [Pholiota molesta]|nr:hypothetical protein BJ912DRAFT_978975 [Pholiota molesta]